MALDALTKPSFNAARLHVPQEATGGVCAAASVPCFTTEPMIAICAAIFSSTDFEAIFATNRRNVQPVYKWYDDTILP